MWRDAESAIERATTPHGGPIDGPGVPKLQGTSNSTGQQPKVSTHGVLQRHRHKATALASSADRDGERAGQAETEAGEVTHILEAIVAVCGVLCEPLVRILLPLRLLLRACGLLRPGRRLRRRIDGSAAELAQERQLDGAVRGRGRDREAVERGGAVPATQSQAVMHVRARTLCALEAVTRGRAAT